MMKNQLAGLMKQAQAMQDQLEQAQAALAERTVTGTAGGDLVEATDGKGAIMAVRDAILSKRPFDLITIMLGTNDLKKRFSLSAFDIANGAGVLVNEVPTWRADQMPYGGIKASGVGREGLKSAMLDFTHERVMVLTGIDL